MRRLRTIGLVLFAAASLIYAVGLGIYAVASGPPRVAAEPENAVEAREVIRRLGLERAYPFAHRFVATPHGRMHYTEAGRGDPVLCLHGNPTWSFLYREFLRGLAPVARVIAPDLIGFGLSEKPASTDAYTIEGHVDDVSALVEALDLRDLTLVMQDWGGPIGLGVAARHPGRVRALVVMNTIGFVPRALDGPPLPLRVLRTPVLGEELVQGLGVFHRVLLPAGIARPERRTDAVLAAYREVQGSWDRRAGALAFPRLIPVGPDDPAAAPLERADAFLSGFDGPVLVFWGMRDPVFQPALIDEWRARFPDARVTELPDAGHFVQEDAHERIVPALRAQLGS